MAAYTQKAKKREIETETETEKLHFNIMHNLPQSPPKLLKFLPATGLRGKDLFSLRVDPGAREITQWLPCGHEGLTLISGTLQK